MISIIICGLVLLLLLGVLVGSIIFMVKSIDKEYVGANVLSFFIPLAGVIIYAVNVGKNDKLAKSSIKTAISGFVASLTIVFSIFMFLFVAYEITAVRTITVTGSRIENRIDYDYK